MRIATVLPGRAHDALNRLLRMLPWSPHQLILGLARWVQRQPGPGYLCLDHVVVEKPFAKLLTWAGWTYSHSKQGHVFGFHVVFNSELVGFQFLLAIPPASIFLRRAPDIVQIL